MTKVTEYIVPQDTEVWLIVRKIRSDGNLNFYDTPFLTERPVVYTAEDLVKDDDKSEIASSYRRQLTFSIPENDRNVVGMRVHASRVKMYTSAGGLAHEMLVEYEYMEKR